MGQRNHRGRRRNYPGPRPQDGISSQPDERVLVGAACRPRRAALLGRRSALLHVGANRPARRRLRLRLRLQRRVGQPQSSRGPALPAQGGQRRGELHPCVPRQRNAAEARPALRLQRASHGVPRHSSPLLVRGQSLPQAVRHQHAAAGVAEARHRRRQRAMVDGRSPSRRHSTALHHHHGAQRHRRLRWRPLLVRHAAGRRAHGRGPLRVQHLRRLGLPSRLPRGVHRGTRRDGVAPSPLRPSRPTRRRVWPPEHRAA